MPVLLRATGAGSRQPQHSHSHRPVSTASSDVLRIPNRDRRVSQASAAPSMSTATTVQPTETGLRRTASGAESQKTWRAMFTRVYKKFHLKNLFPLFFIMIYMVIGSVIFLWLEGSNDRAEKEHNQQLYLRERELFYRRTEEIILQASKRVSLSRSHNNRIRRPRGLREQLRKDIDEALDNMELQVGFQVNNQTQWNLMSAMYFAGTLFTTIGYGDIACVTAAGRIVTVIYSCVGIPLMLITLNDLGKFLYNNINGGVKSFDTAYLGVLGLFGKKAHESPDDALDMVERGEPMDISSNASEHGSLPSEDELLDMDRTPRMSVKVALGITIGWIFFCSALFRLWEDWGYWESCYFMYISLSTIGLGDISVQRRDMMVLCFVFVIVGLSLVSMTINVVQVALEDFYIAIMMKLIMEYQEKLAAGGDEMGASVGMMRMWSGNKTAKFLMPLLSKDKKKMAMETVQVQARNQGIDIPSILTDLDEKTGMPKLLSIEEKVEDNGAPPAVLEDMVQRQIIMEEEAATIPPVYIAHDACTQTDSVHSQDKTEQTEEKLLEEKFIQTEIENTKGEDNEVQTDMVVVAEQGVQTPRSEYQESDVQTTSPTTSDSDMQTDIVLTQEQELQTYIAEMVDKEAGTEIETKNIRIQTPQPVIEQKTVQTDDLTDDGKNTSKMSNARKKLRRAFHKSPKPSQDQMPALQDWQEIEEDDDNEDNLNEEAEDEGSVESLHWDPVDGLHAEKQQPVSRLKNMFEHSRSIEKNPKLRRNASSFKTNRGKARIRTSSE